jgi:hypothetical protein
MQTHHQCKPTSNANPPSMQTSQQCKSNNVVGSFASMILDAFQMAAGASFPAIVVKIVKI